MGLAGEHSQVQHRPQRQRQPLRCCLPARCCWLCVRAHRLIPWAPRLHL